MPKLRLPLLPRRDPSSNLPRTRGDCVDGPRPCPLATCASHLATDVERNGALKLNFPGVEIEDMADSCALDVADRGEHSLEEIAVLMNLTREGVRKIEERVLRKLAAPMWRFKGAR